MLQISRERLISIFSKFSEITIVVIGDIMIDQYIWGRVDRISPEAPVPVVNVIKEETRLGGAGNVAKNIYSIGANVSIASVIGADTSGNKILDMIRNNGVKYPIIEVDSKRQTSTKTRVMANTQHVVRIDNEDTTPIKEDKVLSIINGIKEIPNLNAIIISDYNKGVITAELMRDLIQYSNNNSIPIIVDPKTNFNLYAYCKCITPNIKELEHAAGIKCNLDQSVVSAGKQLIERLCLESLLVTRSENGISLFEGGPLIENINVTHYPTFARKVYDPTGAGDVVISTYTTALLAGATQKEAALISNVAAGISVTKMGAVSVTQEEIFEELNELSCRSEYVRDVGEHGEHRV